MGRSDRERCVLSTASSRQIGQLISEIYDSAVDVGRLERALSSAAQLVGADYAAFVLGDRQSGSIRYRVSVPSEAPRARGAGEALCATPWIRFVLQQEPGRLHPNASLPGSSAMARQLNGAAEALDFGGGLSGNFLLKNAGFGYLAFCRNAGSPRFTAEELAALELLLPHVRQAFEINRHMQERALLHDVMQERYEQYSTGVVLLDREGRVIYSNALARRFFREPGGITCRDDRLYAATPEDNDKLAGLVDHCIRTAHIKGVISDGYLAVPRGSENKPPLAISVSSHQSNLDPQTLLNRESCVMVLLYDVERRNTTRRYILEQLYNLTAGEALLATGLASGKTIKELAHTYDVSRETLRSQLKRVFQKTRTNRQSDLVKLVLTGPATPLE